MQPYLFKFGNYELRFYSLFYIIALLISIFMAKRRAKQLGYNPEHVENMVLVLFFSGLIGARIYYVALMWGYYSKNLMEIFAVWHGGLAIHGGVIGGAVGAFLISKYYKYRMMLIGDLIAPWLLLGQGIGRLGNFTNGEAHGVPTITPPSIIFSLKPQFSAFWNATLDKFSLINSPESVSGLLKIVHSKLATVNFNGQEYVLKEYVPWGISFSKHFLPPAYMEFGILPVHPTFFYELILNFIGAFIMYLFWRKARWISTGLVFGIYLVCYGLIRGFVTFFRADDLMIGFLRAPHVASICFIAVGIFLIIRAQRIEPNGLLTQK